MCCDCCGVRQRQAWVFGLGVLFLAAGIALMLTWPHMAKDMLKKKLVLTNNSESFELWKETPVPMYLEFYLFNWTNPDQIRNSIIKPHFVEMGPYVYLEKHYKENITFHNNDTVSFNQRRIWHFMPELSNGTEQDMVTAAHPITAVVADMIHSQSSVVKKILNFMLNHRGGKLTATKTVGEWIFHGFQDELLDFLNKFKKYVNIPYTRFAWMDERNNSVSFDGLFTMYTGGSDLNNLGQLTHWNEQTENGFYAAPCGKINGTMGELFAPHMNTSAEITIYATDACRYLNLSPNGTIHVYGLTGQQWEGTVETLDSGENYKDMTCFCNKDVIDECPLTGVVECKKCRNNAPVYTSFPHFYLADKLYSNSVSGLNAQAEKHKFSLAVEPSLGIPLEVHARLQINMMIRPDPEIDIYRNVPQVLMPMFWFEQKAEVTQKLASRIKLAFNLELYGICVAIVFIAMGSLSVASGIALTITKRWKPTPIDTDDEDVLITHMEQPNM